MRIEPVTGSGTTISPRSTIDGAASAEPDEARKMTRLSSISASAPPWSPVYQRITASAWSAAACPGPNPASVAIPRACRETSSAAGRSSSDQAATPSAWSARHAPRASPSPW